MVLLALFLRRTDIGIAVRAAAERADRASLLGVPVHRLETVVWVVAALLAFVGAYLRAGVVGLPIGGSIATFGFLLRTLAALVLGRMTDLPAVAAAAVAIGLLDQGIGWNASSPLLIDPIIGAVVIVALLFRGRDPTRSYGVGDLELAGRRGGAPDPARAAAASRDPRWSMRCWWSRWSWSRSAAASCSGPAESLLASATLLFAIVGLSLLRADRVGRTGLAGPDGVRRPRRGAGGRGDERVGSRPEPGARRQRAGRRGHRGARRPAGAAPAGAVAGRHHAGLRALDVVVLPEPTVLRLDPDRSHRAAARCSAGSTTTRRPACTTSCWPAWSSSSWRSRRHPPESGRSGHDRRPRERVGGPVLLGRRRPG